MDRFNDVDLLHKEGIKYFTTDIRPKIKEYLKMLIDNKPVHIMSFIGRTHGNIGDKKFILQIISNNLAK